MLTGKLTLLNVSINVFEWNDAIDIKLADLIYDLECSNWLMFFCFCNCIFVIFFIFNAKIANLWVNFKWFKLRVLCIFLHYFIYFDVN